MVIKSLNSQPWYLDYIIYTTEASVPTGGGGGGVVGGGDTSGDQGGGTAQGSSMAPMVGGVVGAILSVTALGVLILFLLRRRRKKRHDKNEKFPIEDDGRSSPVPSVVPFNHLGQGETSHDHGMPDSPFVSTGTHGLIPASKYGGGVGSWTVFSNSTPRGSEADFEMSRYTSGRSGFVRDESGSYMMSQEPSTATTTE